MRRSKGVHCKPPEWTEEDTIAYNWCIANGVTIAMHATTPGIGNRSWELEITANGKKVTSPKEYGPDELYSKVFELYKFYYNKYKNGRL